MTPPTILPGTTVYWLNGDDIITSVVGYVRTDTRTGKHLYSLTDWTGHHEAANLFTGWDAVLAELVDELNRRP